MADDGLYHGLDPFFDACRREMYKHLKEKGESWREETIVSTINGPFGNPIKKRIPTPVFLEELFQSALNNLLEEPINDQRVDVANVIGLLWMWEEGLATRS
jgi:hypothetical protein